MPGIDETEALHPLHYPEFVAQHVLNTGRYPGKRLTGRTTQLALTYVAQAIGQPYVPVTLYDHFDSTTAHECLKNAVGEVISRLDFRGFHFKRLPVRAGAWTLTFGER